MADRVQEYPHLQIVQPGIGKVHSLINCSYGPVGELNERTRVGTNHNNPGVTTRSTLSLDIPDWREPDLRSDGTNLGYFRQIRDFNPRDETWNEDAYNPIISSFRPVGRMTSHKFLGYHPSHYPDLQIMGLMILSWRLNILETQTDPVRRGESKPWSTPPWTTIIFILELNPEKLRSWNPEPGENQFFTILTLNLEQGRRAYPELPEFRHFPERFIFTDPNPGVRLVITTIVCNLKPVRGIVPESVGFNPEPGTYIVNRCTDFPSNQWTIRPWEIICTNISVRLTKVILPDTKNTNLKLKNCVPKLNMTIRDTLKNNSTSPPKPFSARGRGTHKLTQNQTRMFFTSNDVEYSFQIENLFRPILSSIELKLKLGSLICLYSYYNMYLFSLVADHELDAAVRRTKLMSRARPDKGDSRILFTPPSENRWKEGGKFSREAILKRACGYTMRKGIGKDAQSMADFLRFTSASGFQDPGLAPRNWYLPAGAPLLDFLVNDTLQPTGWKIPDIPILRAYQAGRGITMDMLYQVEVQEITIGLSTDEEIRVATEWMVSKIMENSLIFPSPAVSFDIEEARFTLHDAYRMAGIIPVSADGRLASFHPSTSSTRMHPDLHPDAYCSFPVRIMIGDGISWSLQIRLDMGPVPAKPMIKHTPFPKSMLNLFRRLPTVVGVEVHKNMLMLKNFLMLFNPIDEIVLPQWIDIATLATAAGWSLKDTGATVLGVQVTGVTMNKLVSTGDGLWSDTWDRIPDPLKVYALGDLKMGHMCYVTLMSILLRDLFPDPDILLYHGDWSQHQAATWFVRWMTETLQGLEPRQELLSTARTRIDLCGSLRAQKADQLSQMIPRRVGLLLQVLPDWPTITQGGCRFLLQARIHSLKSINAFIQAGYTWEEAGHPKTFKDITPEDEDYARFQLKSTRFLNTDWTRSANTDQPDLGRPRGLTPPAIKLDPGLTEADTIPGLARIAARSVRGAVLEWARLNPSMVNQFLQRIGTDPGYMRHFSPLYDAIRLMMNRVSSTPTIEVPEVEAVLLARSQEIMITTQRLSREAEAIHAGRLSREAWVESMMQRGNMVERAHWLERMPGMPRSQHRPPRRRSRSKSKGWARDESQDRTPFSAPSSKKFRRGYTSTPMESTPAPNLEHASISSVLTPPDDGNLLRSETMSRSNPNPGKDTLTKFTLWRNPRAVSIIHSVGDLDLNTTDHFKNVASLV